MNAKSSRARLAETLRTHDGVWKEPTVLLDPGSGEKLQQGLAKLVLTLVEVLRQVLERQALRRVNEGTLSEEKVERLGLAFMELQKTVRETCKTFGIDEHELATSLGSLLPSGNTQLDSVSLIDALDRLLRKGVVAGGRIKVAVADIDLIVIDLLAAIYPAIGDPTHAR